MSELCIILGYKFGLTQTYYVICGSFQLFFNKNWIELVLSLLHKRAYIRSLNKSWIVENKFHNFAIILYYLLSVTCNQGISKAEK